MPGKFLAPVALLVVLLAQCRAESAESLTFEKLIPFASAGSVRIETSLKSSEDFAGVELTATISEANGSHSERQFSLGQVDVRSGKSLALTKSFDVLPVRLWSPSEPVLYNLTLTAGRGGAILAQRTVRFGFRSFESRNGRFYLNGRPIFLRGLAINPPGRTIPPEVGESREFAEAYVRFLKSRNVNTIRLTYDSQVWFDVCDELGMMVYQGQYGSPLGSEKGKRDAKVDVKKGIAAYKSLFETYARHPSILIYILANELPVSGTRGRAFHEFLTQVCSEIKPWDPTRLIIGNAGYGEGREGDICDVHRYWGWYYNTFLTYYNLRDNALFGDPAKNQPITFTECVGTFTGASGEFNLIVRKQLGAALNWTGHSPNQREDALRYQSFIIKQATESFRRLRPLNPRLSGIMPFTILFDNWSGIKSFEQMKPKPAMEQLALSYQPILLSWEMWTPNVYAGSRINPIAHIINDAGDGKGLTGATLNCELQNEQSREAAHWQTKLPNVPYYGTESVPMPVELPANLPTGKYRLLGRIISNGRTVSHNDTDVFIAGMDWHTPVVPKAEVWLWDRSGKTADALKNLRIPFTQIREPLPAAASSKGVLIMGEGAWDKAATKNGERLKRFVENGGRILCLKQSPENFDASWLAEPITFFTASANDTHYPPASRPFRDNMNVNPERPEHAVFAGIDRRPLSLWSDYTGWDETKAGFPQVYPVTTGFKLEKPESLARTAILADYDRGLEGIGLCEMFSGKGSVIVCGFDLVNRAGIDPIADRLLANLVRYVASTNLHEVHPLIQSPIEWGNYASERGVVSGPMNGLVVNANWVKPPTNPSAKPLTQEESAWNIRPGDQFVAHGRSPFGPYGYSTGSSLKDLDPDSKTGSGFFWARIPPDRSSMITTVENPSMEAAELTISINDVISQNTSIAAGQTTDIRLALPRNTTNLCVRYKGSKKKLVLLKTEFTK